MHCLSSSVGDIPSKRNVENENMQQLDALQSEEKYSKTNLYGNIIIRCKLIVHQI